MNEGGPKILRVPSMEELQRINKAYVTDDTKEALKSLYKLKPELSMYLVNLVNYQWDEINRSILRGEHPGFVHSWSSFKAGNISIYEKTLPNTLLELLRLYGFDQYTSLPEYYESGVLIMTEFIMPTGEIDEYGMYVSRVPSVYYVEMVVKDTKGNYYYDSFVR